MNESNLLIAISLYSSGSRKIYVGNMKLKKPDTLQNYKINEHSEKYANGGKIKNRTFRRENRCTISLQNQSNQFAWRKIQANCQRIELVWALVCHVWWNNRCFGLHTCTLAGQATRRQPSKSIRRLRWTFYLDEISVHSRDTTDRLSHFFGFAYAQILAIGHWKKWSSKIIIGKHLFKIDCLSFFPCLLHSDRFNHDISMFVELEVPCFHVCYVNQKAHNSTNNNQLLTVFFVAVINNSLTLNIMTNSLALCFCLKTKTLFGKCLIFNLARNFFSDIHEFIGDPKWCCWQ